MNYRKKEVIVQAVKWTGDNLIEVQFLDHPEVKRIFTTKAADQTDHLHIQTLAGVSMVPKGNYVIKGSMGELYTLNKESFRRDYEGI